MFEFEDDDFSFMESFPLFDSEDDSADAAGANIKGTYLGDGVWVVDAGESIPAAEES